MCPGRLEGLALPAPPIALRCAVQFHEFGKIAVVTHGLTPVLGYPAEVGETCSPVTYEQARDQRVEEARVAFA